MELNVCNDIFLKERLAATRIDQLNLMESYASVKLSQNDFERCKIQNQMVV